MFNYLFPIFAFGLVITGIVFLGLQQAADLAKALAAHPNENDPKPQKSEIVAPGLNSPATKPPASVRRP